MAIRTIVMDRVTGTAVYGAGGGITWDSDAAAERSELLTKAAVLSEHRDEHELVETLAYSPACGLRNLDRHLARLADSAEHFGFACDLAQTRRAVDSALSGCAGPARVRLRLERRARVSVDVSSPPAVAVGPVTLAVDDEPVDSSSVWLAHKTTRREAYTVRAARHPAADDVVLVNERGEVTETSIASLAVRIGGRWWTPPIASGCLPRVERGRLRETGVLHERVLRPADLHDATGLAVVNSLRGWRPAVLHTGRPRP